VDETKPKPIPQRSIRVDDLLWRIRWVVIFLVIPLIWIELRDWVMPARLLAWLVVASVVNLIIGIILQFPEWAKFLPLPTLIADTLLFGILPFTVITENNLLAYLVIFPAILVAVRFGFKLGIVVILLLALSLAAQFFLPLDSGIRAPAATVLPLVVMLGTAIFTAYIAQHEREESVKHATQELAELRGAMAGAKLLYQTTDMLNLTTNYKHVLESMLEAGVKGLPESRREDGPPVGIAFLFDEQDPAQRLGVFASRNLTQHDEQLHIEGKAGIIAEAFQTGEPVVFDQIHLDPELAQFSALQHCRSGVCYPLRAGVELYGAVILTSPAPRRPSQQHLELMQAFTNQAGVAFQNAKLYEISRKEQNRIIHDENEMRQKLARDLHDGPTQKIAGLVMQLDYIQHLIDSNPAEAKEELARAHQIAQQATKEIRTALFILRPLALESKGLSTAVAQLGERLRETEKIPIQVVPGDFGTDLDQNIASTVFAIIEEAVNNARKHGEGKPILVSLQRKENTLVAVIQDQGPGFNVEAIENSYDKRASLGLQNMRDRARLIDGNLTIISAPGHGTRVTLVVPLPQTARTQP